MLHSYPLANESAAETWQRWAATGIATQECGYRYYHALRLQGAAHPLYERMQTAGPYSAPMGWRVNRLGLGEGGWFTEVESYCGHFLC
jgi:hypothetical protein